jgi:hypothetical protein
MQEGLTRKPRWCVHFVRSVGPATAAACTYCRSRDSMATSSLIGTDRNWNCCNSLTNVVACSITCYTHVQLAIRPGFSAAHTAIAAARTRSLCGRSSSLR